MGLFGAIGAVRSIERLKSGKSKTEVMSVSDILMTCINSTEASKNLTEEQYHDVALLYNEIKKNNEKRAFTLDDYLNTTTLIMALFDSIAPFELYCGSEQVASNIRIMKEDPSYYDNREMILNNPDFLKYSQADIQEKKPTSNENAQPKEAPKVTAKSYKLTEILKKGEYKSTDFQAILSCLKNSDKYKHSITERFNGIYITGELNEILSDIEKMMTKNHNKATTISESSNRIITEETKQINVASNTIPAEALRTLKELYDEGVITENEFVEKKKQLLNLNDKKPNTNNSDKPHKKSAEKSKLAIGQKVNHKLFGQGVIINIFESNNEIYIDFNGDVKKFTLDRIEEFLL